MRCRPLLCVCSMPRERSPMLPWLPCGSCSTTSSSGRASPPTNRPRPRWARLRFKGTGQWRCEAEQAGRILRGQAARKKQFARILPLLEQSLIEQACNFYLKHGCFPDSYEEMQTNPLLKVGVLPYAGDDGAKVGQAYRLRLDLDGRCCYVALRTPDQAGS